MRDSSKAGLGIPKYLAAGAVFAVLLTGCGDDQSSTTFAVSGAPQTTVMVGSSFKFEPRVMHAPAAGPLTFSIQNAPGWATFDPSTGALSGVPSAADVGEYGQISIAASDGSATAKLPNFSLTVSAGGVGAATISWTPPTTNSDGSTLTNLAGYEISYGTNASALTRTITVDSAGLTDYVIDNLTPGTWYFAISSYNSDGVQSSSSAIIAANVGGWSNPGIAHR